MSGRARAGAASAHATRRVHFSQGGLRGGGGQLPPALLVLMPQALGLVGLLVFGVYVALRRFAWLPDAARLTIVTGLTLAIAALLYRVVSASIRRTMGVAPLPMEMDPEAGVNVICWPDQRDRLSRLETGHFEPEIFRTLLSTRGVNGVGSRTGRRLSMAGRVAAAGMVALAVGPFLGASSGLIGIVDAVAVGGAGVAALAVAWAFVRPTYYRVAPGRIDIVSFTRPGGTPSIGTLNLHAEPVRLDARRRELLVGGWAPAHETEHDDDRDVEAGAGRDGRDDRDDGTGQRGFWSHVNEAGRANKDPQGWLGSPKQRERTRILRLWATPEPDRLLDAVYRAAASPERAGPLPDDRLL